MLDNLDQCVGKRAVFTVYGAPMFSFHCACAVTVDQRGTVGLSDGRLPLC